MRVQCGRNVGTYSLKVGSSFSHGGVSFDWKHLSGTKVIKPQSGSIILANGIYAKLRLTVYLCDSYRQKFNIKLKKTGSTYRGTTARGRDVVVTRR